MIDYDSVFFQMIDAEDFNRFDTDGGYPSQIEIVGDKYVQATVDHDDGPELNLFDKSVFKNNVDAICKKFGIVELPDLSELEDEVYDALMDLLYSE